MEQNYLLLGDDASIEHIGESTLAGTAIVLLVMMYSLASLVAVFVWSAR